MKVRVFGLQGNGTNFIEWTLRNNFNGLNFKSEKSIRNVEGDIHFGKTQNLKHCYPFREEEYFNIIIKKKFEKWKNSDKFKTSNYNLEIYNYYYNTPYREKWEKSEFIVVEHEWCVKNYFSLLTLISDKTNSQIKENWTQPKYRMNWDNGLSMNEEIFRV